MTDITASEWDEWECPYCGEMGRRSHGMWYSDHIIEEHREMVGRDSS